MERKLRFLLSSRVSVGGVEVGTVVATVEVPLEYAETVEEEMVKVNHPEEEE